MRPGVDSPVKDDTLHLLAERARAGDKEAVAALFERYREPCLQAIRRHLKLPLRTLYDSPDVLQQAYVAVLLRGVEEILATPERFAGYLVKTCVNKVLDLRRRHVTVRKCSMVRERAMGTLSHADKEKLVGAAPADEAALARDEFELFVSTLGEEDQALLLLGCEDHDPVDIAYYLETSVEAVRQRIHLLKVKFAVFWNGRWRAGLTACRAPEFGASHRRKTTQRIWKVVHNEIAIERLFAAWLDDDKIPDRPWPGE